MSLDLKSERVSILRRSGGRELQSQGAEQLKALPPIVTRRKGSWSWREEEDRREREGVEMWRRSEMYGGARLWRALKVVRRILKSIRCFMGSQ